MVHRIFLRRLGFRFLNSTFVLCTKNNPFNLSLLIAAFFAAAAALFVHSLHICLHLVLLFVCCIVLLCAGFWAVLGLLWAYCYVLGALVSVRIVWPCFVGYFAMWEYWVIAVFCGDFCQFFMPIYHSSSYFTARHYSILWCGKVGVGLGIVNYLRKQIPAKNGVS